MIETTELKRRIYGKLNALGLKEDKENIVFNFTAGRTSHLSSMQPEELIMLLDKLSGNTRNSEYIHYGKFDKESKQHRYLLSMCMQIGWSEYNAKVERNVADIARLGRFILHFGAIKKPLLEQSKEELQKTIYQFEEMVRKHFQK